MKRSVLASTGLYYSSVVASAPLPLRWGMRRAMVELRAGGTSPAAVAWARPVRTATEGLPAARGLSRMQRPQPSCVLVTKTGGAVPLTSALLRTQPGGATMRLVAALQQRRASAAYASSSSSSTAAAPEGLRLTTATAAELRRQLEARAESGDADAQFKLGVLCCFGAGGGSGCGGHTSDSPIIDPASLDFLIGPGYVVPKDQSESTRITNWREWLKEERRKLKEKGSKTNEAEKEDDGAPNYAVAAKWFHQSARQGHPLAQHFFAVQLLRGLGVDQDVGEAIKWLSRAGSSGNSLSLFELGQLYYDGQLVPQDLPKSYEHFMRAANMGNAGAQFWIGYSYHQGINVNQSIEQALSFLERAAGQNHPSALYYLGMMHLAGDGVPKDSEKAIDYLSAAAEEGEAEAAYCVYFNGDGVDVDYRKALNYYREAARKGHADAMCCEGVMHFRGLGTEQDDEKAFYAYQAAALKGHAPACRNLAYMYQHGRGCAKSETNAHYFLRMADQLDSQDQPQSPPTP